MALAANQVAFYAADQGDYVYAMAVAKALGIPLTNVTGAFNTAANWVEKGTYMVISVGHNANMALYWNPCGWSTQAFSDPACTTPFSYYSYPYDGAIKAGYFEPADGQNGINSLQIALMLGSYAINGSYPANMFCSLPENRELSGQTCSTSNCGGSATNSCPTTS